MKTYHIVYKTTNLINGKIYIGKQSTNDLDDGYLGSGKLLKQAIKKYGKHNFEREIISLFENEKEAYILEQKLVDLDFIKRDDTYNLKCGGEGGKNGYITPDDVRLKIGNANKGKKRTPEQIEQIKISSLKRPPESDETKRKRIESMTGKKYPNRVPQTEETKKLRANANKGKKRTPEQCKAISEGKKRRYKIDKENGKDNYETRLKIGEGNRGKIVSEETKKKISNANKGKQMTLGHTLTEEHKQKIKNANIGRIKSEDECNKLSIATQKRWDDIKQSGCKTMSEYKVFKSEKGIK